MGELVKPCVVNVASMTFPVAIISAIQPQSRPKKRPIAFCATVGEEVGIRLILPLNLGYSK